MYSCIRSKIAGHEAEEEVAKVSSKLGSQAGMAAKFRAMAAAEAAYESSHGLQEGGGGSGSLRLLRQQFVRLVVDDGCFVGHVLSVFLLMLLYFCFHSLLYTPEASETSNPITWFEKKWR